MKFIELIKNYGKLIYIKIELRLQRVDSSFIGNTSLNFSLLIARVFRLKTFPHHLRKLVSLMQPKNPLSNENLPIINIAIPCHSKDFHNLSLVIQGVINSVQNPIGEIQLITPVENVNQLRLLHPECCVIADEDVLTTELQNTINAHYPPAKRGWIKQQVIKFRVTILNETVATLILDSDTMLIQPKVWIDSHHRQLLEFSYEFHDVYKAHQETFSGSKGFLFSFVTHYQLMKKEAVIEIFGSKGEKLPLWLTSGDCSESSAISE